MGIEQVPKSRFNKDTKAIKYNDKTERFRLFSIIIITTENKHDSLIFCTNHMGNVGKKLGSLSIHHPNFFNYRYLFIYISNKKSPEKGHSRHWKLAVS